MWCGKPQPLAADVVNMREDGSDGARVRSGGLGAPGLRIKMLEDELVDRVINRERFH